MSTLPPPDGDRLEPIVILVALLVIVAAVLGLSLEPIS